MALAGEMVALGGLAPDAAAGRAQAEAALADGRAAEVFARMVSALGGPDDFLEHSARYLAHASVDPPATPSARAMSPAWTPARSASPWWRWAAAAPMPTTPSIRRSA